MSTATSMLGLDRQLCFAVYSAAHAFTRFYRPLLAELGVTYPQYLVLLTLWEADGLTVSQIGERLQLDSGTLTPLLKRLETQGLVARVRSKTDERQVIISLTEAGKDLEQKAEGFPREILNASQCSAEELGTLRQLLFDLRDRLDRATGA